MHGPAGWLPSLPAADATLTHGSGACKHNDIVLWHLLTAIWNLSALASGWREGPQSLITKHVGAIGNELLQQAGC